MERSRKIALGGTAATLGLLCALNAYDHSPRHSYRTIDTHLATKSPRRILPTRMDVPERVDARVSEETMIIDHEQELFAECLRQRAENHLAHSVHHLDCIEFDDEDACSRHADAIADKVHELESQDTYQIICWDLALNQRIPSKGQSFDDLIDYLHQYGLTVRTFSDNLGRIDVIKASTAEGDMIDCRSGQGIYTCNHWPEFYDGYRVKHSSGGPFPLYNVDTGFNPKFKDHLTPTSCEIQLNDDFDWSELDCDELYNQHPDCELPLLCAEEDTGTY